MAMDTLTRVPSWEWDAPDPPLRRSRLSNHLLLVGASLLVALCTRWSSTSGSIGRGGDVVNTVTHGPDSYTISADDRELRVHFIGAAPYEADDPCSSAYSAVVSESHETVRVRVMERSPRGTGKVFCLAKGYFRSVTHLLNEPLGARRVVSGVTGREIPLRDTP